MVYNGCDYLSRLGLKLNHVSKRGHWAPSIYILQGHFTGIGIALGQRRNPKEYGSNWGIQNHNKTQQSACIILMMYYFNSPKPFNQKSCKFIKKNYLCDSNWWISDDKMHRLLTPLKIYEKQYENTSTSYTKNTIIGKIKPELEQQYMGGKTNFTGQTIAWLMAYDNENIHVSIIQNLCVLNQTVNHSCGWGLHVILQCQWWFHNM